ncbi:MAG: hypothetical protein Fur0039_22140 [Rhodocyclaceae bacterium]
MLKVKTALVTGSTSGIGPGIAESLARAGAEIVLNGMGDAAQIEAARGRIIRIASAHALTASAYKCACGAAKHGIAGLTKTVALEAAPWQAPCDPEMGIVLHE